MLRALTMALMLMVNDFWSVSGIPHWMHHAARTEDMFGFSDVVFPSFLFCVGLSIPYAIAAMRRNGKGDGDIIRHILSRSLALILMGAFICNGEAGIDPAIGYNDNFYGIMMAVAFFVVFNHYKGNSWQTRCLKLAGWAMLLFLLVSSRSPEGHSFHPYWWGILGLIGWAYLFCALIYALTSRTVTRVMVWVALLAVCLCCTETAPDSCMQGQPVLSMAKLDIVDLVLSDLHIGNASSHLLVMSGVLFSCLYLKLADSWTPQRKYAVIMLLALACAAVAMLSHQLFIISKIIATLPWIFYTLAVDLVLYMLLDWLVTAGKANWLNCLKSAGTATLTCYMVPYIVYPVISMTFGWNWSSAIPEPFGILKCMAFSALCIAITWSLCKLHVKLKI